MDFIGEVMPWVWFHPMPGVTGIIIGIAVGGLVEIWKSDQTLRGWQSIPARGFLCASCVAIVLTIAVFAVDAPTDSWSRGAVTLLTWSILLSAVTFPLGKPIGRALADLWEWIGDRGNH